MMCLRTNWAGTGCSGVWLLSPQRLVCVSYQDLYLLASTVHRSLQAWAGGHGCYFWRELAASFPATGSRESAACSPRVWTRCYLLEFGFKPFSHELHLFFASSAFLYGQRLSF